jgi:4-hydroxyphenylpyruvate dioxygenase
MTNNPVGTNGFEFVEFASQDPKKLDTLFKAMGFTLTAKHKTKNVNLYQQGDVNFLLNSIPDGFSEEFTKKHGPCACGMAFRVHNAKSAFDHAVAMGAKPYQGTTDHIGVNIPAIYGIGDSLLYFIELYDNNQVYKDNFEFINQTPVTGLGLKIIDHLTHNVFTGHMDSWKENYYEKIFNFREIRHFDIQGKKTGLLSRALTGPCNKIRIPLNESKDDKSQIAEYLKEYNGEGIQHIALSTDNIYETIEAMLKNNVEFLDTPNTYYELIDKRLPGHKEDIPRMQKSNILIDGGEKQGGGLLLQIFTQTVIGPIFFEIIQRKGNEGFGEGNFQALFDSIELDQVRRGVL